MLRLSSVSLPSMRLLCLIVGVFSLIACASGPKQGKRPDRRGGGGGANLQSGAVLVRPIALLFVSYDADGDQKTTQAELAAGVEREWSAMSEGKDSLRYIAFSEWVERALGSADAQPGHMAFDLDFNSEISNLEFAQRMRETFVRYDKDKDGALDRSELVFAFSGPGGGQGRGQGGGQRGGGRGEGGGGRGGGGGGRRGGGRF